MRVVGLFFEKYEKEFLTVIVVMVLFGFLNFFFLAFGSAFYLLLFLAGITAFIWGDAVFGSINSFIEYVKKNKDFVLFGVFLFLFFTNFGQALVGGYLTLCVFTGAAYKEILFGS